MSGIIGGLERPALSSVSSVFGLGWLYCWFQYDVWSPGHTMSWGYGHCVHMWVRWMYRHGQPTMGSFVDLEITV